MNVSQEYPPSSKVQKRRYRHQLASIQHSKSTWRSSSTGRVALLAEGEDCSFKSSQLRPLQSISSQSHHYTAPTANTLQSGSWRVPTLRWTSYIGKCYHRRVQFERPIRKSSLVSKKKKDIGNNLAARERTKEKTLQKVAGDPPQCNYATLITNSSGEGGGG
jgi:hypothetical protein